MKKKFVKVLFVCPVCGKEHSMVIENSLLERIQNRRQTGEYIQDILKDFSAVDREKFLSEICEDCQKLVFSEGED